VGGSSRTLLVWGQRPAKGNFSRTAEKKPHKKKDRCKGKEEVFPQATREATLLGKELNNEIKEKRNRPETISVGRKKKTHPYLEIKEVVPGGRKWGGNWGGCAKKRKQNFQKDVKRGRYNSTSVGNRGGEKKGSEKWPGKRGKGPPRREKKFSLAIVPHRGKRNQGPYQKEEGEFH